MKLKIFRKSSLNLIFGEDGRLKLDFARPKSKKAIARNFPKIGGNHLLSYSQGKTRASKYDD